MVRRRKAMKVASLIGIAASAGSQMASGTAGAQIPTCGSASALLDGYATDQPSVTATSAEGTSATILVQHGSVCDTDHTSGNLTAAWVMVADINHAGYYSQVGHVRWYNSSIYPFSQFNHGTGFSTNFDLAHPQTPGTTHTAKTYFTTSCGGGIGGCFKNVYDNRVISQTDFNPVSYFTLPWSPQIFGEAIYAESDLPGYAGSHTAFTSISTQRYSDNQWQPFMPGPPLPHNMNPGRWGGPSAFPANYFDVWTL